MQPRGVLRRVGRKPEENLIVHDCTVTDPTAVLQRKIAPVSIERRLDIREYKLKRNRGVCNLIYL